MTSFQVSQWLRQGIAAAKAGDAERAYELLLRVVEVDEYNEQAWLWLSSVVESDADREVCLENILTINPDNKLAKAGLVHLRSKMAQPPPPPEQEPEPPSPAVIEDAEATAASLADQAQPVEAASESIDLFEEGLGTAVAPAPEGAQTEREKRASRRRRLRVQLSTQRLAIPVLLVLGLLAASVAIVGVLRVGPFDPARRNYARAMRPLLTEYEGWWEGSQGALIEELNSLCGPGADGWRNQDVLLTCSSYPSVDCALLAAHCGADVDAMRKQVDELSREVQETGGALLAAFDDITPPDDIALAHARFLACLKAQVTEADRVGRLARGEPLANPDFSLSCQIFSSAEAEVQTYVGNQ